MSSVLGLFLAQPFGSQSLLQWIFSMTLNNGIRAFQKNINVLATKVGDPTVCQKLKVFTDVDENLKNVFRAEAAAEDLDVIMVILWSDLLPHELTAEQYEKVVNPYAWNYAIGNIDKEMKERA
jgi:hypothetical protein